MKADWNLSQKPGVKLIRARTLICDNTALHVNQVKQNKSDTFPQAGMEFSGVPREKSSIKYIELY